jgi:hypothetical protein
MRRVRLKTFRKQKDSRKIKGTKLPRRFGSYLSKLKDQIGRRRETISMRGRAARISNVRRAQNSGGGYRRRR